MQANDRNERTEWTLSELNGQVKAAVEQAFPETCWVRAETSDVRMHPASGHCYLEFIEKDARTGQLVAKARGSIWAKTFRLLKPYFEMETGRPFASGLKVLVRVTVEFHPVYGFSLTVIDIDPAYTLGDMLRRRMEIIRRLQDEGVFTLNKELPFPLLPQRIAVITSPTAAGYEDFLNQLLHNKAGYVFYTRLFPAYMQGDRTEESVIAALDAIYRHADAFDVVVIIRGGGATSDLNSFDSYLLAANCAQFPLPIITGIGHERDDTIVDLVAHTRVKTPTAVAEFLIGRMDRAAEEITCLQQEVSVRATEMLALRRTRLQQTVSRLTAVVSNRIERSRSVLQVLAGSVPGASAGLLARERADVDQWRLRLVNGLKIRLSAEAGFLREQEQFAKMASPDYILQRGYSLTLKGGRIVKHAAEWKPGEEMTTRFSDGEVKSKVTNVSEGDDIWQKK